MTRASTKIILNGERPNDFSLRSRTRQDSALTALIHRGAGILANAIRQEKEIEGIQARRKQSNGPCLPMT